MLPLNFIKIPSISCYQKPLPKAEYNLLQKSVSEKAQAPAQAWKLSSQLKLASSVLASDSDSQLELELESSVSVLPSQSLSI